MFILQVMKMEYKKKTECVHVRIVHVHVLVHIKDLNLSDILPLSLLGESVALHLNKSPIEGNVGLNEIGKRVLYVFKSY